jgi:hypothetical protein
MVSQTQDLIHAFGFRFADKARGIDRGTTRIPRMRPLLHKRCR